MWSSIELPMDTLSAFAVDAVIKATVVLGAAAIATRLMHRASAALRHLVWTLAVVGAIALPVLAVALPFRLRVVPGVASSRAAAPHTRAVPTPVAPEAERQTIDQAAKETDTLDRAAVDAS